MKIFTALGPIAFFLVLGCDESPKDSNAASSRATSEPNSVPAPKAESSGGIGSIAGGRSPGSERFDKELLSEGYELQAMRSFIKKKSEGLSKEEAYSLQRKVLIAARDHNFEACLDLVSEDIDSFDEELRVGGDLFLWAGWKGDQTVEAYLSKIEERSTNPDAYRHYSQQFIAGTMSAGRGRIDALVAHTLKLDDPKTLNHFCDGIASGFQGGISFDEAENPSDGIVWGADEILSEAQKKNSAILMTLLEERGRDLDRPTRERLIGRAKVAGLISDKEAAMKKYSEGIE